MAFDLLICCGFGVDLLLFWSSFGADFLLNCP